ncbi:hypothetical protein HanXRQr2_Chr03g0130341 [Helianthus annuus]|uniref:Uncharacterized protein n=1 Tax=Helianthus annuus TaxID=4232 RepID=A0A9K3JJ20_HELAN|nr:hypothetical protein HanXRQr2_Chr03g0130341 [Helianthus annuus]
MDHGCQVSLDCLSLAYLQDLLSTVCFAFYQLGFIYYLVASKRWALLYSLVQDHCFISFCTHQLVN